jgi:hypothetical protein
MCPPQKRNGVSEHFFENKCHSNEFEHDNPIWRDSHNCVVRSQRKDVLAESGGDKDIHDRWERSI